MRVLHRRTRRYGRLNPQQSPASIRALYSQSLFTQRTFEGDNLNAIFPRVDVGRFFDNVGDGRASPFSIEKVLAYVLAIMERNHEMYKGIAPHLTDPEDNAFWCIGARRNPKIIECLAHWDNHNLRLRYITRRLSHVMHIRTNIGYTSLMGMMYMADILKQIATQPDDLAKAYMILRVIFPVGLVGGIDPEAAKKTQAKASRQLSTFSFFRTLKTISKTIYENRYNGSNPFKGPLDPNAGLIYVMQNSLGMFKNSPKWQIGRGVLGYFKNSCVYLTLNAIKEYGFENEISRWRNAHEGLSDKIEKLSERISGMPLTDSVLRPAYERTLYIQKAIQRYEATALRYKLGRRLDDMIVAIFENPAPLISLFDELMLPREFVATKADGTTFVIDENNKIRDVALAFWVPLNMDIVINLADSWHDTTYQKLLGKPRQVSFFGVVLDELKESITWADAIEIMLAKVILSILTSETRKTTAHPVIASEKREFAEGFVRKVGLSDNYVEKTRKKIHNLLGSLYNKKILNELERRKNMVRGVDIGPILTQYGDANASLKENVAALMRALQRDFHAFIELEIGQYGPADITSITLRIPKSPAVRG